MGKNNGLWFIAVIGIIAVVLFYKGQLQSVWQPSTVNMWQCAGSYVSSGGTPNCRSDIPSIAYNSEAVLGEYKIITEISTFRNEPIYSGGEPVYACEGNTCDGTATTIDSDGCQLYINSQGSSHFDVGGCSACYVDIRGMGGNTVVEYGRICGDAKRKSSNGCSYIYDTITCGGRKVTNQIGSCCGYSTCWGKFSIYKNNNLIKSTPWLNGQSVRLKLDRFEICNKTGINSKDCGGVLCPEGYTTEESFNPELTKVTYYCTNVKMMYYKNKKAQTSYSDVGLIADVFQNNFMYNYDCRLIENYFSYTIPDDAFDFNVSIPKSQYYTQEEAKAEIKITNNFKPIKAELCVEYNIPYATISGEKQTSDTFCEIKELTSGDNVFLYSIPTTKVTDTIYVTPRLEVLMAGSDFNGVNGICYKQEGTRGRDLSTCQYVSLGHLGGDKFTVQITTREAEYLSTIQLMNLTLDQQIAYIKSLNSSIEEKAIIISKLETESAKQAVLIKSLDLNIQEQAQMINELALLRKQQETQISNLQANLAYKAELVSLLQVENSKQAELIKAMRESFSNQGTILDNLNKTVEEDADIIKSLTSNLNEQGQIISSLKSTNAEKDELIKKLTASLEEQKKLVQAYQETQSKETTTTPKTPWTKIIIIGLIVILVLWWLSKR